MTELKTLEALGLSLADGPTPEALAAIQAATDDLEPEAIALKQEEQEVKERKRAVRARWDELVAARALLYTQRPSQPGDVTAKIGN